MKKSIIILLLLSFIYQNTSSFWIVTSFFISRDYIAKNICVNRFDTIPVCNGKCYLQKELSADSDKEQQIPNIKYKEVQPLFYHPAIYSNDIAAVIEQIVVYPEYQTDLITSAHYLSVFQPPEQV